MTNQTIPVWNPATERKIDDVRAFSREEVDECVARSVEAQRAWANLPLGRRQKFLFDLADAIDAHREKFATLESQDVGKPMRAALAEAESVAGVFRYYAGAIDKLTGETIPVDGGVAMTFREPIGVVGVITPWNFQHWQSRPSHEVEHDIAIDPASRLAQVIGKTAIGVNSYHHQAVETLGAGLCVTARAGEVVEAFEDPERNLLAVQWHPEHLYRVSPDNHALFDDLVIRARVHHERKSAHV